MVKIVMAVFVGGALGAMLREFSMLMVPNLADNFPLDILVANLVAALIFVAVAHVAWEAAGVIAISSVLGGQAGSAVGRRLNPLLLRMVIVAAGLAALVKLLLP